MGRSKSHDPNTSPKEPDTGCSVCLDLLGHMQTFCDMLDNVRNASRPAWLTVEDVAKELRLSPTIIYRLVRTGTLRAINVVDDSDGSRVRGHYRVKRDWLEAFLSSREIKPSPAQPAARLRHRANPKPKDFLGL